MLEASSATTTLVDVAELAILLEVEKSAAVLAVPGHGFPFCSKELCVAFLDPLLLSTPRLAPVFRKRE